MRVCGSGLRERDENAENEEENEREQKKGLGVRETEKERVPRAHKIIPKNKFFNKTQNSF